MHVKFSDNWGDWYSDSLNNQEGNSNRSEMSKW